MKRATLLLALGMGALAFWIFGVSRNRMKAPGRRKTLGTRTLEAGAALLQSMTPIHQFNLYLDGFHFESGHLGHQMRACHYCTMLNEDLTQCVIFDGTGPGARLVGVEYIVSETLFQGLPEDEKPLWHSHQYEIKSGQLAAPGIPAWAELRLMEKLKNTYGKIWRTWDTGEHASLPLGIPKLMMGFTEDGQIVPALLAERDRLLEISSARNRRQRERISDGPISRSADSWQRGEVLQTQLAPTEMKFR